MRFADLPPSVQSNMLDCIKETEELDIDEPRFFAVAAEHIITGLDDRAREDLMNQALDAYADEFPLGPGEHDPEVEQALKERDAERAEKRKKK